MTMQSRIERNSTTRIERVRKTASQHMTESTAARPQKDSAPQSSHAAIVLSGGGALGAYEAGALKYIMEDVSQALGHEIRFDIIAGTSVGALNGCFMAGYADRPKLQGHILCKIWESLEVSDVYALTWREVRRIPKFIFGSRGLGDLDDIGRSGRLGGLLNSEPLERLVQTTMDFGRIRKNIEAGHLQALALNATHLATGNTHTFVQTHDGKLPAWSTVEGMVPRLVEIEPAHVLASAALPWVFPAVNIHGDIYVDGGLKLNTPISPAIRLGAKRVLVMSLDPADVADSTQTPIPQFPSAFNLLGYIFSALMESRSSNYDLRRLRRLNRILAYGHERFGPEFLEMVDDAVVKERGSTYRHIETLEIRPKTSLTRVANQIIRTGTIIQRSNGLTRSLLRKVAEMGLHQEDNPLLGYLLFDGEFARELIRMGYEETRERHDELVAFFSGE